MLGNRVEVSFRNNRYLPFVLTGEFIPKHYLACAVIIVFLCHIMTSFIFREKVSPYIGFIA